MAAVTENDIERASAFLGRMLPHILAGMTLEAAGQAVLDRDRQLAKIALAEDPVGIAIRKQIADDVYNQVKAELVVERDTRKDAERTRAQNISQFTASSFCI